MSSAATTSAVTPADDGRLTDNVISSFQVAKVFKDMQRPVTSLSFNRAGDRLVVAAEDERLWVYDARGGKLANTINSKKYGCTLARFTHHQNNIIFASTKEDDAIRYMSLHDNKFLKYFKGHKKRVVSLAMSPRDDSFLSGSIDDTVRLWDLRSTTCQGLMHTLGGEPCVAIDPTGLIFAVGLGSSKIRLYDVRNFTPGPFAVFPIAPKLPDTSTPHEWTSLTFSDNGEHMLVSTRSSSIYIVNATNGSVTKVLTGHHNPTRMPFQACFTPDSQYVMCGSHDGKIHVWETDTGRRVHAMDWHREPPRVVAFNPKYMMFASADTSLAFWIPPAPNPSVTRSSFDQTVNTYR